MSLWDLREFVLVIIGFLTLWGYAKVWEEEKNLRRRIKKAYAATDKTRWCNP